MRCILQVLNCGVDSEHLTLRELHGNWSKVIPNFIEPIRKGVRNNCLLGKVVIQHFVSLIMIGFRIVSLMVLTNQR